MVMQRLRKGDDVIVLVGKNKGKRGTVLRVLDNGRILVEGVNLVKRHTRGNPQSGEAGGIIEKELPVHSSNVALFNPRSSKGDRVSIKNLEDGKKVRCFRSDGEVVDV